MQLTRQLARGGQAARADAWSARVLEVSITFVLLEDIGLPGEDRRPGRCCSADGWVTPGRSSQGLCGPNRGPVR